MPGKTHWLLHIRPLSLPQRPQDDGNFRRRSKQLPKETPKPKRVARLLHEQSPARMSRGRRNSVDGRDAKTRLAVYKNAQQVACQLTNGNSDVYCSHPMCKTRLWLHEEDIPIGGMSSSGRNAVMECAHIVAAVRGGDATGRGDCIALCGKHNTSTDNQLQALYIHVLLWLLRQNVKK